MAKIVVFGLGPMRWESSTRLFALALRSWHFAHTLARAGHRVLLFSLRGSAYEGWPADKVTHANRGGVSVWSISEHLCHERPEWIGRKIREFGPDAVVGVNKDPAAVAVNFAAGLPFWADINGDPMAEAQVKASTLGGDWNINDWYRKFAPVLHRADRFSTCSRAQRAALIGQLGMIGRMTAKNDGYEFVSAIPNSLDDDELDGLSRIRRLPRVRGNDFVLLWSGGYNTWTDPDVLFAAIEQAMRAAPEISFVSTGGEIPGHHLAAYDRFRQRVSSSPFRRRFELAGWVQTAELPAYYAAAHAAILVDRFSYEGVLGARTRMLDWLAAGLPIVSTELSEISLELAHAGIARTALCGDVDAIADAILWLCNNPQEAHERGEIGRAHAHERLRASVHLAPLVAWAEAPERAPDGEHHIDMTWLPSARLALQQHTSLVRTELREHGVKKTMGLAARFAVRRIRNGVLRTTERLGLADVEMVPMEAPAPDAPLIEPPRYAAFQWRERFTQLDREPRLTVVVFAASDTPVHVFRWTCDQVRTQYVGGWRAVLAQSTPLSAELEAELRAQEEALGQAGRVVERVDVRVADLCKHHLVMDAEWVLLLPCGSLLRPDALAEFGWTAVKERADLVYADEQHVDETNIVMPVRPKPGWFPELLLARAYLGRTVLIRGSLFQFAREHADEWPQDALIYDAILRATDKPCRVVQVPSVLSQVWTPQNAPETAVVRGEQRIAKAQREALRDALWRRGVTADVEHGARPGAMRVRWPVPDRKVTVIVLGDAPDSVVERCRNSLRKHVGCDAVEIAVARPRRSSARLGTLLGDARYAVVVDPHLDACHAEWLPTLLEQAARPSVAAVSPKLVSPNGTTSWQPSHLDSLEAWVAECVQDSAELSPLCFAGARAHFADLEVPFEERKRGTWLAGRVASWNRSGKRTLYTPFSFLHARPHNGQVRAGGARMLVDNERVPKKRRLRQSSSR